MNMWKTLNKGIMKAFGMNIETDTATLNDESFLEWVGIKRDSESKKPTSDVTYFTCLKMMSETVAKMPWKLYQKTNKGILTGVRGVWNNLTDEQQANLAKTIAGTNQFSALQTIMSGLSDEAIASGMSFSDYAEALQNCDGTASDMAATMQDNLLGRLTQLKSKLEDIGITVGNALLPFMEKAVAKIGELADKFAALSPQQQETILKIAGVVAAIGPLLTIVGKAISVSGQLSSGIGKVVGKLAAMGTTASGATGGMAILKGALAAITSPVGIAVAAIAAITAVIVTLWNTNEDFRNKITEIWDRIKTVFTEFGQHITDKLNSLGFDFENFGEVVKAIWEGFCNLLAPIIEGVFNNIANVIETTLNVITGVFDLFVSLFTGDWSGAWDAVKGIFESVWNGLKEYISNILNTIKGVADAFLGLFGTSWDEVWNSIKTMATWTIRPKKDTTANWKASGRILEVNEWGVEETASGKYILRIGNGKDKFLDLQPVVDTENLAKIYSEISNFNANMQQATSAANAAAQSAQQQAAAAQAGAAACKDIQKGINSMSDSATGKKYTIGVEAGLVYLEETT